MRKMIIGIFLVCILAIGIAGITTGTIGELTPITKEKVLPETTYNELKVVLEKENIDMTNGLNVEWKEVECRENFDQETDETTMEPIGEPIKVSTTCVYELFKKNLFNGSTIEIEYAVGTTTSEIQALLDQAIQDKVDSVKEVWEARQAIASSTEQEGTTTFKTSAKEIIK